MPEYEPSTKVHSGTFLWQVGIEVECFCKVWTPGVLPVFV